MKTIKTIFFLLLCLLLAKVIQGQYPPRDYSYPSYTNSTGCDLADDEYGRPYYSPYDNYRPPLAPTYPDYYTNNTVPNTRPPNNITVPFCYYHVPFPPRPRGRPRRPTLRCNGAKVQTYPSCVVRNECNEKLPRRCRGNGVVYDKCERRCTCRKGRLYNCCRVRKEWTCMTKQERCRYIKAIKLVSTNGAYKSCYDQLIRTHKLLFNSGIHLMEDFLPWHRWYILALENLLRKVDCRITVPYWDWSLEPTSWQTSQVWDTECGFGGNGQLFSFNGVQPTYCVNNGPFSSNIWSVTPSGGSDCLRRRFNGNLPDCASIAIMQRLGVGSFNTWHTLLTSSMHDNVHCNIGGDMCTSDSANDPIFFLHHGFIDKLWADWQNESPAQKTHMFSTNNGNMPGIPHSPRDLHCLQNQPGCVKICYQQPCKRCNISTYPCPEIMRCCRYSPIKLARIIPRPYPSTRQDSFNLFRANNATRTISRRYVEMMNKYGNIYSVLQANGYEEGNSTSHHYTNCTLSFNSYIETN